MTSEYQPSPSKRRYVEEEGITNGSCGDSGDKKKKPISVSQSTCLLRSLKPIRVLSNRSHDKFIALLAQHEQEKTDALLLMEKTPFPVDMSSHFCDSSHWFSSANEILQNDIYHKLNVEPNSEAGLGTVKVTIAHPATPRLIAKYEEQSLHLFRETPELYDQVVKPHVEKTRLSLNWVYNVLDGSAEKDRQIYSDEDPEIGFLLSADLKWDGHTPEDMYCLALVRQTDLASIRDLRGDKHLPLLRNISAKGRQSLVEKLGISASQLRVYFHYPPSFYHLHVHFTYAGTPVPGCETERAHLLDTVINNLELMPDYYQKATLTLGVRERDELYGSISRKGQEMSNR